MSGIGRIAWESPDQLLKRIQWAERVIDIADEVMIYGSTHLDADGNALICEDVFFRLIDEFTA